MKKKSLICSILVCFGLGLLLSWGCASSPNPRFYTLDFLSGADTSGAGQPLSKGPTIGLGPIGFPDYLERPGIVTRSSANTIEIAEFDLWAGSLKEDFTRVIAENLSRLLKTDKLALYPFSGTIPLNVRILINVERFEGAFEGQAYLEATWILLVGPEKKEGLSQKSRISEAVKGSDYRSLVAAQSRAVERLSREIAGAVQTLSGPSSAK
jgi:hypothetical protein